jgi:flagellar basal body-associated protein FliL
MELSVVLWVINIIIIVIIIIIIVVVVVVVVVLLLLLMMMMMCATRPGRRCTAPAHPYGRRQVTRQ